MIKLIPEDRLEAHTPEGGWDKSPVERHRQAIERARRRLEELFEDPHHLEAMQWMIRDRHPAVVLKRGRPGPLGKFSADLYRASVASAKIKRLRRGDDYSVLDAHLRRFLTSPPSVKLSIADLARRDVEQVFPNAAQHRKKRFSKKLGETYRNRLKVLRGKAKKSPI